MSGIGHVFCHHSGFHSSARKSSRILSKAETWASERNIAPETILNYRLAPDMLPLARQVQIVSDTSKEQPHASPGRTSRATKTTKRHLPSFSSDSTRPVAFSVSSSGRISRGPRTERSS